MWRCVLLGCLLIKNMREASLLYEMMGAPRDCARVSDSRMRARSCIQLEARTVLLADERKSVLLPDSRAENSLSCGTLESWECGVRDSRIPD